MSYNGSGSFSINTSGQPVVATTLIEAVVFNAFTADIATGLSTCLLKDGTQTVTANIPMAGYVFTGLGSGNANRGYSARTGDVQDNLANWCGTAGGTANALTLTPTPAITAYVAGQQWVFKSSSSANTGATTVAISGLSTIAVQNNGAACIGGELLASQWYRLTLDTTSTAQLERLAVGRNSAQLLENVGLSASVAANALTVTLTGEDGQAPSTTNPVRIGFRNATLTTGTPTVLTITGATTLVVPSGAELGLVSNVPARLYVGIQNDAGTARLCIFNTQSTTGLIALPSESAVASSNTIGTGSDGAGTLYASTGATDKAIRWLGFIEITEATPGTWASEDTLIVVRGEGIPWSGDLVQRVISQDGAVATGTTTLPYDDTIPQNTEGDQYLSVSVTPNSAINRLECVVLGNFAVSSVSNFTMALFQDSTANALKAVMQKPVANNDGFQLSLRHEMRAATVSATTFKMRAGCNSAATTTFNGSAGGRIYGGVMGGVIEVREIFA